jgi:hypothetical protein
MSQESLDILRPVYDSINRGDWDTRSSPGCPAEPPRSGVIGGEAVHA